MEHPSSNLVQNSKVPKSQEDYITQVSEETESRVTKKLSQEFSRTENRIFRRVIPSWRLSYEPANSRLLQNPPETSQKAYGTNQGDPHPETSISQNQMRQNSGLEDAHDRDSLCQQKSVNF